MKLHSFSYKDLANEWEILPFELGALTLLVGISGVGKTQILEAIHNLKRIAKGASLNGVEWDATFETEDRSLFQWKGAFESRPKPNNARSNVLELLQEDRENAPKLLKESIIHIQSGENLLKRDVDKVILNNQELPAGIDETESILKIFNKNDILKPLISHLSLILIRKHDKDANNRGSYTFFDISEEEIENCNDLTQLKSLDKNPRYKLLIVEKKIQDVFSDIKSKFIEIFPQIKDIKISIEEVDIERKSKKLGSCEIEFQVSGSNRWVSEHQLSSGMHRAFWHLVDIHLWPDGSTILIDEFENSLGVNCIDVISEDVVEASERLQFIATSHHPYIINKIPVRYWKIVTRNGGKIKVIDSKDLPIGEKVSRHKAFTQLMNSDEYLHGITID